MVVAERGKYPLGVITHWSDTDSALFHKYEHLNPLEICATDDPLDVLTQIGSCERLISSTLHGLIAADSFGIPRQAEPFPRMDHPWEGGDLKFRDYSSAIELSPQWGVMQIARSDTVDRIKSELFGMFQTLARTIHAS